MSDLLGLDASGNGNNWTTNNLSITDQMLDSPTNNFATLNAIHPASTTLSEGNLKAGGGDYMFQKATMGMSSGKWYWEWEIPNTVLAAYGGIADDTRDVAAASFSTNNSWLGHSASYYNNFNSSSLTSTTSIGNGDILAIALDLDASQPTAKYYVNGSLNHTDNTLPTDGRTIHPYCFSTVNSGNFSPLVYNFGQDSSFAGNKTTGSASASDGNGYGDFYYTPPTGYLALCTQNLPEPDVVPSEAFNTVTYTGNGSTQSITGVGFQPDLTWIKARNIGYNHVMSNSLSGVDKHLRTDSNVLEQSSEGVQSFDTDGFSLDNYVLHNASTKTYVAWNWKAGGNPTTDNTATTGNMTSGSHKILSGGSLLSNYNPGSTIYPTRISANVDAGFSIVSYTGTGSSGTVGHGLSSAPEMVIVKNRTSDASWGVLFNTVDGSTDYIYLNLTNAAVNSSWGWSTSNVLTLGGGGAEVNGNGSDHIAYCFHSVDGYSKVGSYTGNGSTDGTFVHTGFKPAYVMVKETTNSRDWQVKDNTRNEYNVTDLALQPNQSYAEASNNFLDLLSNGFKMRSTSLGSNNNGGTYIFLAFAEHPFKYSTAR